MDGRQGQARPGSLWQQRHSSQCVRGMGRDEHVLSFRSPPLLVAKGVANAIRALSRGVHLPTATAFRLLFQPGSALAPFLALRGPDRECQGARRTAGGDPLPAAFGSPSAAGTAADVDRGAEICIHLRLGSFGTLPATHSTAAGTVYQQEEPDVLCAGVRFAHDRWASVDAALRCALLLSRGSRREAARWAARRDGRDPARPAVRAITWTIFSDAPNGTEVVREWLHRSREEHAALPRHRSWVPPISVRRSPAVDATGVAGVHVDHAAESEAALGIARAARGVVTSVLDFMELSKCRVVVAGLSSFPRVAVNTAPLRGGSAGAGAHARPPPSNQVAYYINDCERVLLEP